MDQFLGNEFWAAIAGAVVGGLISYFMQRLSLRADTTQTKLPRAQQKLKQTSFEIPQEDWDWLNIHCATMGIKKGELMLRLLSEYRAKHNKTSPKKVA